MARSRAHDTKSSGVVHVLCRGKQKNRRSCRVRVHFHNHKRAFCTKHASQEAVCKPMPRLCEGLRADGQRCRTKLPLHRPADHASFCSTHTTQSDLIKWVQCAGRDEDVRGHRPCEQSVKWEAPWTSFCVRHQQQLENFGCPIALLSSEASLLIIDLLEPAGRVALALANRSCRDLVMANGRAVTPSSKRRPLPRLFVALGGERIVLDARGLGAQYIGSRNGWVTIIRTQNSPRRSWQRRIAELVSEPRLLVDSEFRCGCFRILTLPNHKLMLDLVTPIHQPSTRVRYLPTSLLLLETMRKYPALFSPTLARCVACRQQLDAVDSASWSKYQAYHRNAITQRRHLTAIDPDNNPETLLCWRCHSVRPHMPRIFLQHCVKCHGEPTPTEIARAYWAAQMPQEALRTDKLIYVRA